MHQKQMRFLADKLQIVVILRHDPDVHFVFEAGRKCSGIIVSFVILTHELPETGGVKHGFDPLELLGQRL